MSPVLLTLTAKGVGSVGPNRAPFGSVGLNRPRPAEIPARPGHVPPAKSGRVYARRKNHDSPAEDIRTGGYPPVRAPC
ncbi:hypothetical protein GCM10018791_70010 [Streptomyces zaomyceticus]|nr:hypothetical protein GCM10018791_70010 [Streptomyces zaomyceticus]